MAAFEEVEQRLGGRRLQARVDQRVVHDAFVREKIGSERRQPDGFAHCFNGLHRLVEIMDRVLGSRFDAPEAVQRLPFFFRRVKIARERQSPVEVLSREVGTTATQPCFTTVQAGEEHPAPVPGCGRHVECGRETLFRLVDPAEVERQDDAPVVQGADLAIDRPFAREQVARLVVGVQRLNRIAQMPIQHAEVDEHLALLPRP